MVWKRKAFATATLVLLVVILSGLLVSPAVGQQPARVKVLIGFTGQPGRAERALVRGVGGTIKYTYHMIPVIAANVHEGAIAALQANPNVAYVEPDAVVYALDNGDDELRDSWGVDRIDAEVVHATNNKGTGVRVAIIDSGIDYTHPDLDDNYAGGWDFVNGDNEPINPAHDGPMDDYGHGTHVAGIVAATYNDRGVVGVAPEADLYALKVLDDEGRGYTSAVIAALDWSRLGPDPDSAEDDPGIQVINMSIGWSWSGSSKSLEVACDAAYEAGIVLVAAAGNWARTVPAAFDSVIAVAGSDEGDRIPSSWSNGNYIELTAPGVLVYSTWPEDTPSTYDPQPVCVKGVCYKYGSGTSMASPHVAGTVALMIFGGSTDPDDIREELQATADKLTRIRNVEYPDSYQGFGLVDAEQAVLGTEFGDD